MPVDEERSGYVPNVVYSCGAMLHNRMLILPYALSDTSTTMARIDLDELLDRSRCHEGFPNPGCKSDGFPACPTTRAAPVSRKQYAIRWANESGRSSVCASRVS